MITRAPMLTTRFGAYLHREVPAKDAELSHVGPDTPCGEYLRRFWQPICFSDELKDQPHRAKILGEELVVFRDLSGNVGLLELHCPHRGASGSTLTFPTCASRISPRVSRTAAPFPTMSLEISGSTSRFDAQANGDVP